MKKVLISIKKNYLAFSYRKNTNSEQKKILNTNIISDNELIFSEDYILNNPKIVSCFLKELCEQYKIRIISFQKNDMFDLIFPLFSKISFVKVLYLFEEKSLPYYICEGVIKSKNIKQINCYSVPRFMIELLDKNGVLVTSRNEILFTSTFMEDNNLVQFSKLFYKISIKIKPPMSDNDFEDFKAFCKINKYLRTIHLEKANIDDIEKILKVLKNNRINKIKILIHDNITDENTIASLKKLNKSSKKSKIYFQLVYSEDYLKNNVLNQTMVSILKICGGIIACLIVTTISYIIYTNYKSMHDDVAMKSDINKTLVEGKNNDDDNKDVKEIVDKKNEENKSEGKSLVISNEYLSSLLTVNKDTVGWLKVPNTNIDYPVVQREDNDYYLTHNFYNKKDPAGWVFMDFRNDPAELNQNTIFYAHNRYSNGVMFGTLQNTLNKDWYTNKDNQYIQFDTLYGEYKWRIFSIYKIDVTTDYLKTMFVDQESFLEFANMLKNRSIYDFKVDIKENDKIISLSTCMGANNQQRLVVHAVLEK